MDFSEEKLLIALQQCNIYLHVLERLAYIILQKKKKMGGGETGRGSKTVNIEPEIVAL